MGAGNPLVEYSRTSPQPKRRPQITLLTKLHVHRQLNIKIIGLGPTDNNHYSSIPTDLAQLLSNFTQLTKLSIDIPERYSSGLLAAMKSPYITLTRVMALHTTPGLKDMLNHCPNVQGLFFRTDPLPRVPRLLRHLEEAPFNIKLPRDPPAQLKYIAMQGQIWGGVEGEFHIGRVKERD